MPYRLFFGNKKPVSIPVTVVLTNTNLSVTATLGDETVATTTNVTVALTNTNLAVSVGLWTPAQLTAGQVSWFDAAESSTLAFSGSNLTQWSDRSPAANHATPFTTGPTLTSVNSLGSLSFNAQGLKTTSAISLGDFTAFVVFTPGTGGSYERLIDQDFTNGFWFGRDSTTQTWGGGIRLSIAPYGYFVALANGTCHQSMMRRSGTTQYHSGNGGAVTNSNSCTGTVTTSQVIGIGAGYNDGTPSDRLNGVISEVLLWSNSLSADDQAKVEGYLAWKWGTQSSLPGGHAYKSARPSGLGAVTVVTGTGVSTTLTNTNLAATTSLGNESVSTGTSFVLTTNSASVSLANVSVSVGTSVTVIPTTNSVLTFVGDESVSAGQTAFPATNFATTSLANVTATGVQNVVVIPTTNSATVTLGDETVATSGNITVIPTNTNLSASTSLGDESVSADVTTIPASLTVTPTLANVTAVTDSGITVPITSGLTVSTALSSATTVSTSANVYPTTNSITVALGDETVAAAVNVSTTLTNTSLSATPTINGVTVTTAGNVTATGSVDAITTDLNNVTVTGSANVYPSTNFATVSLASVTASGVSNVSTISTTNSATVALASVTVATTQSVTATVLGTNIPVGVGVIPGGGGGPTLPPLAFVQSAEGTTTGSNPVGLAFSTAPTAGNLIVLATAASFYNHIPDAGWIQAVENRENTGSYIWWRISDGSNSFSFTTTSTAYVSWVMAEFEGGDQIDATTVLEGAGNHGLGATASVVPSTGERLVIAALGGSNSEDLSGDITSWTNGFTHIRTAGHGPTIHSQNTIVGMAYKIVTGDDSTGVSTGGTYPIAVYRTGQIASFKGVGDLDDISTPAFRSLASLTYTGRTDTTVSKPTGTVDGDILLAAMFAGGSSGINPVTPPTGFKLLQKPNHHSSGGFHGELYVYWKRASGEPSSYTFSHTTNSTQIVMAAISGCVATGNPIDSFAMNWQTESNTSIGWSAISPNQTNTLGVSFHHNWSGNPNNALTGWTEQYDTVLLKMNTRTYTARGDTTLLTLGSDSPYTAYHLALRGPAEEPVGGGTDVTVTLTNTSLSTSVSLGDETVATTTSVSTTLTTNSSTVVLNSVTVVTTQNVVATFDGMIAVTVLGDETVDTSSGTVVALTNTNLAITAALGDETVATSTNVSTLLTNTNLSATVALNSVTVTTVVRVDVTVVLTTGVTATVSLGGVTVEITEPPVSDEVSREGLMLIMTRWMGN